MRLPPFFRCKCGKIHCRAFVGPLSVCTCGLELYRQAFNVWESK